MSADANDTPTPAPDDDGSALSPTMRGYLATIARLADTVGRGGGFVSTSELAERLDVSAPAVNRMVTKLRELELIQHEPYQGIRLTPTGTREAHRLLRSQRIIESFLVNIMGMRWHEVLDEAARISRVLSPDLEARMLAMAGSPTHCPHGEPIPAPDGSLTPMNDAPLTDSPLGVPLVITRVRTHEPDRLEYLAALHLTPGTAVELVSAAPFNGPVQLRLPKRRDDQYRIIGHNLAAMIHAQAETTS